MKAIVATLLTLAVAAPALTAGAARAGTTVLEFDGLFEQITDERDALLAGPGYPDRLVGRFVEQGYVFDYLIEGINVFWPDGWTSGTMGLHDGDETGATGSEIDRVAIRRADGGAFTFAGLELRNALVTNAPFGTVYDFSKAQFDLHPTWSSIDDVPVDENWQSIGRQALLDAGGSSADWEAFLATVTETRFNIDENYAAFSDLGLTAGGITATLDTTRGHLGDFRYVPVGDDGVFGPSDLSTDLGEMTELVLEMVLPPSGRGPEVTRSGNVISVAEPFYTGLRNDETAIFLESLSLSAPMAAVPVGPALPMLAGAVTALAVLRRRRAGQGT